jgi:hypothetical protein
MLAAFPSCSSNRACMASFQAVLVPGNVIPDTPIVKGYDFSKGRDLDGIMEAMLTTGFQATTFGEAIREVNRMVRCNCCQLCRLTVGFQLLFVAYSAKYACVVRRQQIASYSLLELLYSPSNDIPIVAAGSSVPLVCQFCLLSFCSGFGPSPLPLKHTISFKATTRAWSWVQKAKFRLPVCVHADQLAA